MHRSCFPLPRWRDNDAACLTISSHYHSPTPSLRLPLQLHKPTANQLDSLLTEKGFEDCILTFVIRCRRGLSQGLLHLVHSWGLLRQRRRRRGGGCAGESRGITEVELKIERGRGHLWMWGGWWRLSKELQPSHHTHHPSNIREERGEDRASAASILQWKVRLRMKMFNISFVLYVCVHVLN